jgi:transposase
MAAVMIGVDPHKGSHTAVAIDAAEVPQGTIRVRASADQASKLVEWAADWPERTWAVEGAGGLGHLLAQQLFAAGEQVVDVQPKLGARVRLLSTGTSNKNDPNDARSVAVAALRSPGCQPVAADDHAVVLRVWSRRHRQLSSLRTQAACRLHAALCELVPGGVAKNITAARATAILAAHQPDGPVGQAWHDLAAEHLADLRRIDERRREARKNITAAVKACGTSLTQVFGVGAVIAATVIGDVADVTRFPTGDRFASTTAPHRSRCPPAAARSTGFPCAATAASTTRSTWPPSLRSPIRTALATPTTSANSPKARHQPKPAAPSSARSATPSTPGSWQTPAARQPRRERAREGNRGTTLNPARPAHTPNASSSDKPLPNPPPPYACQHARAVRNLPPQHTESVDKQMGLVLAWLSVVVRTLSKTQRWPFCASDRGLDRDALRL